MSSRVDELTLDLMWSVWSELGIPGVHQLHGHTAIDPEPLLVATPWLAREDVRLRDEVYRWCVAHADRISASRLQTLVRRAPPEVRAAFEELSATLGANTSIRWPAGADATPWDVAPSTKHPNLRVTRPSMVRLRVRAIAGVGARADVLAELIARPGTWLVASDLDHVGYSKRNASRVLTELAAAGVVRQRADRNALAFQLAEPDAWRTLANVGDVGWPRWDLLLDLAIEARVLASMGNKTATVRRVNAANAAERFKVLADGLGLERPADVRGDPSAYDVIGAWSEAAIEVIALGTSPAFLAHTPDWIRTRTA